MNLGHFYRYLRYLLREYKNNDLLRISGKYKTDKGLPGHGYVRVYDAFLKKYRDTNIKLCEIGLLHIKFQAEGFFEKLKRNDLRESYSDAPSLDLWREYLPRADIVGFDIVEFNLPPGKHLSAIKGDQSKREDLQKIVEQEPVLDVIIDDALHASRHQQISLAYLFKYLKPGGYYFIEDLHWQPEDFESKDVPKTVEVIRHFMLTGKWVSPLATEEEKRLLEAEISEVYLFDSFKDSNIKKSTDAIAVIIKK